MSIKFKEVVSYSITDCTNLSRAELLGFMSVDFIEKTDMICQHLGYEYFDKLIRGPWKIQCNPSVKSIEYQFTGLPDFFSVEFKPNQKDGMIIQYTNKDSKKIETWWSADKITDFLGV